MPAKRSVRIALAAVVVIVSLAALQMGRNYLQANGAVLGASSALPQRPACSTEVARTGTANALIDPAPSSSARLRLDYAGAEALIDALERDSLSDADVDSLFRIQGLCAMVDNVTRFVPPHGASEFRKEIRAFVRKKKSGKYDRYFALSRVWSARQQIRAIIAGIRANERRIIEESLAQLDQYRPDMGSEPDTNSRPITAYFVAGGVSTGFAFEKDPLSFYANLVDAQGDLNGVAMNMAHEAYHAMQFTAQMRAGIDAVAIANDSSRVLERLFATTLTEGTANYAVDPTRSTATGPDVERSRERFRRNAEPQRVAEHFRRFDAVLGKLRAGRMTWDQAYHEGFTDANEESFYRVGYQMAKAIDQYCGPGCIGKLFTEQPIEFFRRYIALYRKHPEIVARFSPETEAFILGDGTKPTP